MINPFQKATKAQAKLRLGIMGPSNSGKTWTALEIGTRLGRVAVIDTEHGSASKYAKDFDFDVLALTDHHPQKYMDLMDAAAKAGYDVVVLDSLTHAWDATKRLVDAATVRSTHKNSFKIWGQVGQIYNDLMKAIVACPIHVIATMRSKTEYVIEEEGGKKVPRKLGLAPNVREGAEFEFDVVLELDHDHNCWANKTRCRELDGVTFKKDDKQAGEILQRWLSDGTTPTGILSHQIMEAGFKTQDFVAKLKAAGKIDASVENMDGIPAPIVAYSLANFDRVVAMMAAPQLVAQPAN